MAARPVFQATARLTPSAFIATRPESLHRALRLSGSLARIALVIASASPRSPNLPGSNHKKVQPALSRNVGSLIAGDIGPSVSTGTTKDRCRDPSCRGTLVEHVERGELPWQRALIAPRPRLTVHQVTRIASVERAHDMPERVPY